MNKIIEKYIQFAIDNGYPMEYIGYDDLIGDVIYKRKHYPHGDNICLEKLITSKPFIEAVARGVAGKNILLGNEPTEGDWGYLYEKIQEITIEQAIAIRDNKLEEFINNLLPNE